jgi:SPP1 family predicted phage head-tail adaptor
MVLAGKRRHRVRLENPTLTTDGDGGYTDVWSLLSPGVVWASIEPATVSKLERVAAGTVQSSASHIVTMPYHSGVTTKTRITFIGRTFTVAGVVNPEERNIETICICSEVVA